MLLTQRQEIRNIGIVKLVDFGNGCPRLNHPAADGSPQRRHPLPSNRTPFGEIDGLALRRWRCRL